MTKIPSTGNSAKRAGAVGILPRLHLEYDERVQIDYSRLEVLVIRRSPWVAAPNALCFPGGGIEENETPEAAVRREFFEEVGLDIKVRRFLTKSSTPSGAPLFWFLVESIEQNPESLQVVVRPEEVAGYEWRTLIELLDDPDFLQNNLSIVRRIITGDIALD